MNTKIFFNLLNLKIHLIYIQNNNALHNFHYYLNNNVSELIFLLKYLNRDQVHTLNKEIQKSSLLWSLSFISIIKD